jgi:hypothetical protein
MNPRTLDMLCRGIPVYIRRRPVDGSVYATVTDFSRFLPDEPPLEVVRIPVAEISHLREWKTEDDPRVIAALARHR